MSPDDLRRRAFLWAIGGLTLACVVAFKSKSREVVVYTSVDQVFSEPVLRAFEKESGTRVRSVFAA